MDDGLDSKRGARGYTGLLVLLAIHPIDYSLSFPLSVVFGAERKICTVLQTRDMLRFTIVQCKPTTRKTVLKVHADLAFGFYVMLTPRSTTLIMYSHRFVCHYADNGKAAITLMKLRFEAPQSAVLCGEPLGDLTFYQNSPYPGRVTAPSATGHSHKSYRRIAHHFRRFLRDSTRCVRNSLVRDVSVFRNLLQI